MKEIKSKAILRIGNIAVTVGFYDTALAQEIVEKLPLCMEMEDFGGREYCGGELSFTPKVQVKNQTYFDVGDFVYWGKGNALAFFYAEGTSKDVPSGIVVIGKILSDLSSLSNLPNVIKVNLTSS